MTSPALPLEYERLFHSSHLILAIGLVRMDASRNRNHTGILYRDKNDKCRFLHFGGPFQLLNDEVIPADHVFVALPIDSDRASLTAQLCDHIYEKNIDTTIPYGNTTIPYGVRYSGHANSFDETGKYALSDNDTGLTCATFILALLARGKIKLLDLETWQPCSPEDIDFQTWVFRIIARYTQFGPSHFDHYRRNFVEKGCLRFKPEEVAGGALEDSFPVPFSKASQNGKLLTEKLDRIKSLS